MDAKKLHRSIRISQARYIEHVERKSDDDEVAAPSAKAK